MRKYYTRPCNFYYGNYARKLIREKKALSLCGRSNIAFDQVEVFYRRKKKIVESIQRNVTAEDMTVLAPVLSPSVKNVLVKILPDIAPLMEGIGPNEETVPIKVSTFASLPGDIQDFIIQSSTNEMDTNNVPLDTSPDTSGMMARQESEIPQTSEGDMDYSQIDEGLIS